MKLYEYQAKKILKDFGIRIPIGVVSGKFTDISFMPAAVKAQVLAGGRGKAGGVKIAKTKDEAKKYFDEIISMKIKGSPVKKILMEEAFEIEREYYLGITVDRSSKSHSLMFSDVGGIDIEEVAKNSPEKIIKIPVTALSAPSVGQIPNDIVEKLIKVYFATDATLVEINPLVKTKDGIFFAADAKIIIDDNALFRHPELAKLQTETEEDDIEAEAHKRKLAYVRLDGDIGIIGNGAGLVMTTMDEVKRAGGRPASFLDIGGGARCEVVKSALEILTMDKNIKGIFFNVFGGITRCDEVARGIIESLKTLNINIPIVVRLTGTMEEEGKALLSKTDLIYADSMQEGARIIVERTR